MTEPTLTMLSPSQVFDLARKYVYDHDEEGFNKMFSIMTPQMEQTMTAYTQPTDNNSCSGPRCQCHDKLMQLMHPYHGDEE